MSHICGGARVSISSGAAATNEAACHGGLAPQSALLAGPACCSAYAVKPGLVRLA